ncbi:MAG TPA: hypothetical protein VGQ83_41295 [Polyangia bacterium]|jgi:CheY-like chemotaxis protein
MRQTILHVEDDEALREAVKLSFQDLGFAGEILAATTLAGARATLAQRVEDTVPVTLLLVDVQLRDVGGGSISSGW